MGRSQGAESQLMVITIHELVRQLTDATNLSCDKRLFPLINRELNLSLMMARVKYIGEHDVIFDVIKQEVE
jgi:hypothetical protein